MSTVSSAPRVAPTSNPNPLARAPRTVFFNLDIPKKSFTAADGVITRIDDPASASVTFTYRTSNEPGDPQYDSRKFSLAELGISTDLPSNVIKGRLVAIADSHQAAIADPNSRLNSELGGITSRWTLRTAMTEDDVANAADVCY